jgi:RNA polymerase sigma-70 factor (ECF subfamily)
VTSDEDNLTMASLSPGPRSLLVDHDEQRLLLEGLRNIPVKYQIILEMYYWQDLRLREIADALDIAEGTARRRIQEARDYLVDIMEGIASSSAVLRSTLSNLDNWAHQCREDSGLIVADQEPDDSDEEDDR